MDALATASELELHLQRDLDTDRAEQAVQLASGAVRAYCGWDLSQQTTTLQVDGTGTAMLTLPTLALGEITEIRINGVAMDANPIDVRPSIKGQLYRAGSVWPRFAVIDVDCTHGYDPVPDLVKLVTLEQAVRTFSNPEGLASATTGRVSRTYAGGANAPRLTALDERLLDRYRI